MSLAQHVSAAIGKVKGSPETTVAAGPSEDAGARASDSAAEQGQKAVDGRADLSGASNVASKQDGEGEAGSQVIGGSKAGFQNGVEHGGVGEGTRGTQGADSGHVGLAAVGSNHAEGTGASRGTEGEPADNVSDLKKLDFVRGLLSKVGDWKAANPGKALRPDQQTKLEKWVKQERMLLRRLNMLPAPRELNGAVESLGPGAPQQSDGSPVGSNPPPVPAPQPQGPLNLTALNRGADPPKLATPSPTTSKQPATSPQPQHLKPLSQNTASSPSSSGLKPQPAKLEVAGPPSLPNGQTVPPAVVDNRGSRTIIGLADDLGVSEILHVSQALQASITRGVHEVKGDLPIKGQSPDDAPKEQPRRLSPASQAAAFSADKASNGVRPVDSQAQQSPSSKIRPFQPREVGKGNGLAARVSEVRARLDAVAETIGFTSAPKIGVEPTLRDWVQKDGDGCGLEMADPGSDLRGESTVEGAPGAQEALEGIEQRGGHLNGKVGPIMEQRTGKSKSDERGDAKVLVGEVGVVQGAGAEINGEGTDGASSKGVSMLEDVTAGAVGVKVADGEPGQFALQATNGMSGAVDRNEANEGPAGDSPNSGKENRDGARDVSGTGMGGASVETSRKGQKQGWKAGKAMEEGRGLVQCGECGKLRILLREGLTLREELNAQDWWTCEMAGGGASCDDSEDEGVDLFNVLKPRETGVKGVKRKLETVTGGSEGMRGNVLKGGTQRKPKPMSTSQKKPKLKLKDNNFPSSQSKALPSGAGGSKDLPGLGIAEPRRAGSGASDGEAGVREKATSEKKASGVAVQHGEGRYFVPNGFTLVFTARNTEKSVAINAPGDLRYHMPSNCNLSVDLKGRKLTYLQSFTKLEEFLANNQEHPLVKGLTANDFIFSGRKFETMLVQAYGAGAERDKWVFENNGGVIKATRAGKEVPPQLLHPEIAGKKHSGLARKRKGPDKEDKKSVKKLKKASFIKVPKVLVQPAGPSKQEAESSVNPQIPDYVDNKDVKELRSPRFMQEVDSFGEGLSEAGKSSELSAKLATPLDAKESKGLRKNVVDFVLEDDEGDMRPVDDLNLVQEDEEGKLKRLTLRGRTEDGENVEMLVFRWKVTLEPFGIAVKLKKAGQWVYLDVDKADTVYCPVLAPLKRRLALLRPLLAASTLAWTDIKCSLLRSLDPEVDFAFVRTWLEKLRAKKDEVLLALASYIEHVSQDVPSAADGAYIEDPLDAPFNDDTAGGNEVTAEDEEVARSFLEEQPETTKLGDSVCAICDDGGGDALLMMCDGECMRSFHPRQRDGEDSQCESLGMSEEEAKRYLDENMPFLCPNCKAFQHQCYICGKLGDSDKQSLVHEVYKCEVAGCGHFYHPSCVARYELPYGTLEDVESREAAIQDSGGFFRCPLHTCEVCKGEEEDLEQTGGALVKCRRCPVAYHVNCLPDDLPTSGDTGEPQRAWGPGVEDKYSIEQRLCYCRKHLIDKKLLTPKRNHLKLKPRNRASLVVQTPKRTSSSVAVPGTSPVGTPPGISKSPNKASILSPNESLASDSPAKSPPSSVRKNAESARATSPPSKTPESAPSAEEAEAEAHRKLPEVEPTAGDDSLSVAAKTLGVEEEIGPSEEEALEPAEGLQVIAATEAEEGLPLEIEVATADDEIGEIVWEGLPSAELEDVTSPEALKAIEKHLSEQIEQAEKAIAIGQVRGVLVTPSIYSSQGDTRSRIMPKSRLDPICNAIEKAKAALGSGNPELARRICQQGIPGGERQLDEVKRLESVMRVFLAPFLHGSRYTSFGRHFTHPDKLREVVERLHPYIDDGDVVVDFCCGANDFSVILAQKLNETGKTNCQYINFDLITARNDFFFTKKDWFHVTRADLDVEGRRLIIGLNPPFGVNAALANKFIEHALTWEPKLMVLIVPPVTKRLDDYGYSLCWEDHQVVAGRSFYLPGSLNKETEANLDQWNKVTPPLYLWSHNAFYDKHMQIAHANGHFSVFDPQQPPPPGASAAWEQQQAFFHQQQLQALQPQWGQFPGVLQPPQPRAPFAPPAPPVFQAGGYGAPQYGQPPPQMPVGATPPEMRMAGDQAMAAIHAEAEARLQGLRQTLADALADHQQSQTARQAWLSRFEELKAENERLKSAESAQCALILQCHERSFLFAYGGNIPEQIKCDAEGIGLQQQLAAIHGQLADLEAQGQHVYDKLAECEAQLKELEGRIKEAELEMERVLARQREQLAALEQAQAEQQRRYEFGGYANGLPGHPNGFAHGRPEGSSYGAERLEGSSYGAERPHRDEHRRERRDAGAPYRHNGDGRKNWATRPATRGRGREPGGGPGRGGWGNRGVKPTGPIERGEPLLPMDGQWLPGRENEAMPGFREQGLPPPPPFLPPNAEFEGFPGGPPRLPFF